MGRLTIDGTIDHAQFWPTGESDADTTKLVVDVRPGAIRYEPPNGPAQATTVFDGAHVRSSGASKPVIKDGKLTVRPQGLDAPALHIQPQSMKGATYKGHDLWSLRGSGTVMPYRQHQAETATVLLSAYLGTLGPSPLHCQFFTHVQDDEGPGNAVDKYERFVGNPMIDRIDLNFEIPRRGLAVVSLYNSMRRSEIQACLDAWKIGRTVPRGNRALFDENHRPVRSNPDVPPTATCPLQPRVVKEVHSP